MPDQTTPVTLPRRRRKASGVASRAASAADALVSAAPAQERAAQRELKSNMPELGDAFCIIREHTFSLNDPSGLFNQLQQDLELTDALTPGALQASLNRAEANALKAHQLFINARADFERFERECEPVVESMRDAANKELQAEKDAKQRSKAITDADVRGRASVLFTDEWSAINDRRIKAEGMLAQLKVLAHLWDQRCFSLSTMLNAGRRS